MTTTQTCYERTLELLDMGIPSIPIKFNSKWNDKGQKFDKPPVGSTLPCNDKKSPVYNGFEITRMGIKDCRDFIKFRTIRECKKMNACIILCNNQSPVWVLDYDAGFSKYEELGITDLDNTIQQLSFNSNSDRRHFIFKKDDRLKDKGEFDNKNGISGDILCGKGWVFAYPTSTQDGQYMQIGKFQSLDDIRGMSKEEWTWLYPHLSSGSKGSSIPPIKQIEKFIPNIEDPMTDEDDDCSSNNGFLSENVEEETIQSPTKLEFTELRKVLDGIDVDGINKHKSVAYTKGTAWTEVMFAIHAETRGSDIGKKIFIEWSKLIKGFDNDKSNDECIKRWDALKDKDPNRAKIKLASLYDLSSYKGCNHLDRGCIQHKFGFDMEDEYTIMDFITTYTGTRVDGKEKITALLNNLIRVVARIEDEGGYYVVKKFKLEKVGGERQRVQTFQILKGANALPTCRIGLPMFDKPVSIEKIWITYHKILPMYQSVVFEPNYNIPHTFNLWTGWRAKDIGKENINMDYVNWFLDHIKIVWANNDNKANEYILNWISWITQKPNEKTGKVILLYGEEGDGKGSITNYLGRYVWGRTHTVKLDKMDDMLGNFNSILSHKVLVDLPEVPGDKGDFHKQYNMFKTYITDSDLVIKEEYKPRRQEESYHNFILASNNANPMPITETTRRFSVFKTNPIYNTIKRGKIAIDYWNNFYANVAKTEYINHIFTYFNTFDITITLPSAPPFKTDFQHELAKRNLNTVHSFVRDFEQGCEEKHLLIGQESISDTDSITIGEGYFPSFGWEMGVNEKNYYNMELDIRDSLSILKNGIFSEAKFYGYYKDYCQKMGERKPLSSKYFRSEIIPLGFEKGNRLIRKNIKNMGNGNFYIVFRPNMTEAQIEEVGTEEAFSFASD